MRILATEQWSATALPEDAQRMKKMESEIEELDRKSPTRLRVKLRPFDRSEDHPGWVTAWDRHGEAIEQAGAGARIEGKLVEKKGHMNVEVLS